MMIIYFCLVFFINLAIENLTLIRLKHIRLSVESITEWFHLSKNLMYDISKENMFLIFVEESGLILPLFLFFFSFKCLPWRIWKNPSKPFSSFSVFFFFSTNTDYFSCFDDLYVSIFIFPTFCGLFSQCSYLALFSL